jgi:SAM-dependent methyltransferase
MTDYYESNAQQYFDTTVKVDPSSFLIPLATTLKHGSILDIGCGSGRDLRWLKDYGFNATGLERSPKLAALAREYSGCPVIEEDFLTFDFSSRKFDALISIGAFVHINHKDFPQVIGRVIRALSGKKLFFLTLKEGKGFKSNQDGRSFTLWQPQDLEAVFATYNLRINFFSRQVSKLGNDDIWLSYMLHAGSE